MCHTDGFPGTRPGDCPSVAKSTGPRAMETFWGSIEAVRGVLRNTASQWTTERCREKGTLDSSSNDLDVACVAGPCAH